MNGFVNWEVACRTNTLGWEQCDVMKREEKKTAEERSRTVSGEADLTDVELVVEAEADEIDVIPDTILSGTE